MELGGIPGETNLLETLTISFFLTLKPDEPNDAKTIEYKNTGSLDYFFALVTISCSTIPSLKLNRAAAIGRNDKASGVE